MTYYKFLAAGRIAPFSGHPWSDDWLDARQVVACEQGVHACRPTDLPFWLHDELWRIELAGPVTRLGHQVVAPRARLVGQVVGWNAQCADAFGRRCLARTAAHAAAECGELDDGALAAAAERLADHADPDQPIVGPEPDGGLAALREVAVRRQEAAALAGQRTAAQVCGYLVDAIDMLGVYPVAGMGYVAARAAQARRAEGTRDRYAEERRWQATWLVEHLDLEG
ncbi:hypothetical protein O7627_00895 [Solwaraspora sp. WMMD1047]|uniref:hypothetical protein n=1 Tax=Solwaraspora sp. WMMD1047 TaxID=3016102 RepID=UPI0024173EA1|nr:hypothetical protein [Solwaraspora sp. WMMD1047]MDG4827855.1 hypothetical protein [Solwaraspora sp. WMMD1047]